MIYGIDLGTTYSACAYVNPHGEPVCINLGDKGEYTIPSAVLFIGDNKVYVGESAIENSWMEGSLLVEFAKRDIGLQNGRCWEYQSRTYTPEMISALILRKMAREIGKERSLPPARDVVVSHPQYFFMNQKEATKESGELAGLNVVATIAEPNAAAIAYGVCERSDSEKRDVTVLVFDLGGGTFDVSLMQVGEKRFQMLGSDGDGRLGGIDWDMEIVKMAKEKFRVASGEDFDDVKMLDEPIRLRKEAQRAKEELSRKDMHAFPVEAGGMRARIEISRSEFEQLTRHLVEGCIDRCETLFQKTGFSWSKIDQVLMVGSSTKIPLVQEEIKRVSGKDLIIDRDPKLMVAKGAAIWGHWVKHGIVDPRWVETERQAPSGLEIHENPEISGCTAHGLGVLAKRNGQDIVRILIQQNTPTPHTAEEIFYTTADNATSILVPLFEGESEEPNPLNMIGEVPIDKLPPRPKGSPVGVKFNIDVSGRMEVQVTDIQLGRMVSKSIDRNILRQSPGTDADLTSDPAAKRRHLAEIVIL